MALVALKSCHSLSVGSETVVKGFSLVNVEGNIATGPTVRADFTGNVEDLQQTLAGSSNLWWPRSLGFQRSRNRGYPVNSQRQL